KTENIEVIICCRPRNLKYIIQLTVTIATSLSDPFSDAFPAVVRCGLTNGTYDHGYCPFETLPLKDDRAPRP
ncbi:MAG: hypothetical protein ACI8PT_004109, partial [Gammaproteobacteria bacterium]